MRIKLADIKPNPFRDFNLYPIDKEQVVRLQESMEKLGFFSGVTARRNPDGTGFELAAGHHRLAAAKRAKLDVIEGVVDNYSDDEMVAIMTAENMTQRGFNAGATHDSVAAYAKIVTRAILLGNGEASKFLEASDPRTLARAQASIAEHGPGEHILYRAINGFGLRDRHERKADDPHAELLGQAPITQALAMLKSSGQMGKIVANALKEVKAIRDERDALAAEEEAKRQRAEERAEAARIRAEEKAAVEKAKAEERAEAAKAAAKAAEGARKAEAERRAKEAEKERAEAAKRAEKERIEREAERKAAEKERAEREAAAAKERERRRVEAEAVKAQRDLDKVYDPRCVHVFRLPSHESSFRKAVLSESGRRFIPMANQFELAKQIVESIKVDEKKSGHDLGGIVIADAVIRQIDEAMMIQNGVDKEEKANRLRMKAIERVNDHWATIKRNLSQAEIKLAALVEEQTNWEWEKALFPMDHEAIVRMGQMLERFNALKEKLGY